ncbi:MAG TPA: acyltransferase family protein [Desulfobacteraceae bacterium]|nr:acyltransferase family protein [Desulfobacteraceae bacterium]HPJ66358.1 acyltransferase family protein [Desulfobacteraceae bacterium]HPQ27202.1 acyltransferase family protein [Desulfobacteraceae bacterium]
MNKKEWIYIAKGIGILLVVMNHFSPTFAPDYWFILCKISRLFGMPLFFLLSGYLCNPRKDSLFDFTINKIQRLVFPFFTIAALFLGIKLITSGFVHLRYPVTLQSIVNLWVDPMYSYMPLLWFIHTLFFIFIIYKIIDLFKINDYVLLASIVLLNVFIEMKMPHFTGMFPSLVRILYNSFFFVLGHLLQGRELFNRNSALISLIPLLFLFSLSAHILFVHSYGGILLRYMAAVLGIFIVIMLSILIEQTGQSLCKKIFSNLGFYLMTIYLFHTLFVSSFRIFFEQVFPPFLPFLVIAFFAVGAGLFFPLLLEKFILRKYQITKKYILGLT